MFRSKDPHRCIDKVPINKRQNQIWFQDSQYTPLPRYKQRHDTPLLAAAEKSDCFILIASQVFYPAKVGHPSTAQMAAVVKFFRQHQWGSLLTCCLCNSLAFQRPWFWSWSRSADPMTVKILSLDELVCTGTPVTVAWQERLLLYYTGPGSNPSTGLVFWSRSFWFWS